MSCTARGKHVRASRRLRSVKKLPPTPPTTTTTMDSSPALSIDYPSPIPKTMIDPNHNPANCQLCLNPSPFPSNNPTLNFDDAGGWGYCTEEQLENILMKNLEFFYNEALSRLVGLGYDEDTALKAVLRNGYCYGGMDVLTNIMHNAEAYLKRISEGSSDSGEASPVENDHVFPDLRHLQEYSLAGMVCLMQQLRPQLSRGDAMWCLLMSDLNVSRASTVEIPNIAPQAPSTDGLASNSSLEGCSNSAAAVGVSAPQSCRFHSGWGFGNNGVSEFPTNEAFPDIECPKRFNLSPTMKSLLTKVRLVKCPKCRNLLPESVDVPVYRCGGCDTILQAKCRKKDAQNARPGSEEVTDAPKDKSVEGLEENKESNNLDKEMRIPSSVEHSSELGNVKEQDMPMNGNHDRDDGTHEFGNSNRERHELPNGVSPLPELVGDANRDEQTNGEISPIRKAESGKEANIRDLNEEPEKSQMSVLHKRVMSEETLASTEYVDPCSEFSGPVIGDSCRSPTTIPGHHHAYDGSISSLDVPADQFHSWDSSRGKQHSTKDEENLGFSRERLRKNKFVSSKMPETSRGRVHGIGMIYGRNRELPPRIPGYKRAPRFIYEDEGSSDHTGNSFFPHGSSYHLSHSPEEFVEEEDNMRLLQIVYELEDQLKKAHLNRIDGQKSRAAYYSHELPQEEGPVDLNFLRHNPWARNFRSSRIPFSAEMTRTAHQRGYSQWGHFPRARQQSEPLLPPAFHNKSTGSTRRRNSFGPYSSWPSSPQGYMGSEFSIRSGDPSYELQKLRKFHPERKDHSLRRHLRPIGEAAPFMTCYHCSEILQLPEDSFIFQKRCLQVRCGACSMVLKFSLENRTRVIPYKPNAHVPPPSEADNYDNFIDARNSYSASDTGEINGRKFYPTNPRDTGGSPLHELMGYYSVSQVFKGCGPSAKGAISSTRKST